MSARGETRIGYFGKLPSRGDFLRAGLSRDFVAGWDGWLQSVIPAARAMLGEGLDIWTTAPVWRFALAAGLCGPREVTGVWLASTDAVGRAFPFVIAAEATGPSGALLSAIEPMAIGAVRFGIEPATLDGQLARAPRAAPAPSGSIAGAQWWTTGTPPRRLDGVELPDAATFRDMLAP